MSRSSTDSSWGRREGRRSLFSLPVLSPSSSSPDEKHRKLKRNSHRRAPSLFTDLNHPDLALESDNLKSAPPLSDSSRAQRPPLSVLGVGKRPSLSAVESLRSPLRSDSDEPPNDPIGFPLHSTPSSSTSLSFGEGSMEFRTSTRTVLLHGEVQTSAGMFRKKKEYLVLTETHMIRFKTQARAAELFRTISGPGTRPYGGKHGSFGSQSEIQTMSDSSGDKEGRVPLRQVVAVYRPDDGKPHFAVEVCYLDEESAQSSSLVLQFGNPEERDVWLRNIRGAANDARVREPTYISDFNIENAARIVERGHDYDPANCAVYKIVQRTSAAKSSRASSDDLLKVASTVCFLAIGVHKVHIIQLVKPTARSSSPTIGQPHTQISHGILTMTAIKVSDFDDTLMLTFRQPLQPPKQLLLASLASCEIAARLHFAENFLRPECGQRLYKFSVPPAAENLLAPPVVSDEEHSCLDRTLAAYCIAYGVNPTNVRYTINYNCEDAPRFELLPPSDARRPEYGPLALLAVMRALRYNESFGSLSFAGIDLDSLNGLHDNYGQEMVCTRTKRGTPIKLSIEVLGRACLLVQEVRALAAASKKLRRLDFSGCVTSMDAVPVAEPADDDAPRTKDIGCGIVEALVPLCRHQTTNVDWIGLNGIHLSDTDLDYLVSAAVDKSCHFRAIELDRCGLNDRSMGLILDALRAQDNTLEAVEIAGNPTRLDPSTFDSQLSMFGFIRKLNLSYVSRTSGTEPLITAETLLIWRLQELRLSGTGLNAATIDSVATYLAHPQSMTLHELYIDNSYLSGRDVATLLHSLSNEPGHPRDLHLDISQNYLTRGLESVTKAIADGYTPSHLSMRAIEYREESLFRRMLAALTANKTIQWLDMSQTALQGDASEETCRALRRFLAENNTLLELDLSGEESRLATFKFGTGINDALQGLKQNKTIQCLRVEKQKLGLQGASTLAEVLKENTTLRELYCGNNEIPLHGLTDLVNSLIENTTLVYLPTMDDGREAAFKSAEVTMKGLPDLDTANVAGPRAVSMSSTAGVRRGLNSVRRSAVRAASAYTPSFPALNPSARSTPSPELKATSPQLKTVSSPLKPSSPHSLNNFAPPPKTRRNSQSPVAASVLFTVQDIQTTHRLLSEQWDRQCYRLAKYLERNWNLLNGIPVDMEIEDEKFERPESVGSVGKLLEMVKSDTTPRKEKEAYFEQQPGVGGGSGAVIDTAADASSSVSSVAATLVAPPSPPLAPQPPYSGLPPPPPEDKFGLSFQQFIVEPTSRSDTPDSMEYVAQDVKALYVDPSFESFEEPKTPTQGSFPQS